MNTLFQNPLVVNPSSTVFARDAWGEMIARLRNIRQSHADFDAAVDGCGAETQDSAASGCTLNRAVVFAQACVRLSSQAKDAAWRLGLNCEHIALLCQTAASGREGVIDITAGLRARIKAGIVVHIYRARHRPSPLPRKMHQTRSDSAALATGMD